jgi:hypothetical protein
MPLTEADIDAYAAEVHNAWFNRNQDVLILSQRGLGATIIVQRAFTLLPALRSQRNRDRVEKIYAAANLRPPLDRPFRAPHHTVSERGLFGDSNRPGEFDLASYGVLFLDELHEFRKSLVKELIARTSKPFYLAARIDPQYKHLEAYRLANDDLFRDALVINLLTGVVEDRQVVGGHKVQFGPRLAPGEPVSEPVSRSAPPPVMPAPPPAPPVPVQDPSSVPLTARERERVRWMVEEVRWYDNYPEAIAHVLRQRAKNRMPSGFMGLPMRRVRRRR